MPAARRLPPVSRPLQRPSPISFAVRCAMLGCLMTGGVSLAQAAGAVTSVATRLDDATPRDYDIGQGPLGTSLGVFANQSGLLLSYDPDLTRGRAAPALKGRYTVLEGARRLLANTGLQLLPSASGTYILAPQARTSSTATELSATVVDSTELLDPQRDTYRAPRSTVHLSREDLDRFGTVSVGDMLKGVAGVQVGDSRNGGALDVNIRGIQGQSRVAVRVDGSEQALDVYRGYGGTQQRSYIDPDLLSSVTVNKGPSTRSGAIGGSVEMKTLGVDDILVDGKDVGLRLTGNLWNNGVDPDHRNSHSRDEDLSAVPRDKRNGLFGSKAESGSAAFAYSNERVDLVAAYAHRNQGNYFSGKHGQDRYRLYDRDGDEQSSVASTYNAGEEVLNSSSQTDSYLLKTTWRLADDHTLELGYRRFEGRMGEIMPSDIFRFGTAGIYQYPQSEIDIDTYTARYHYLPEGNPWVDLTSNLWMTDSKTSTLSAAWMAPKSQLFRTDRSWSRQDDRRIGGDLNNVSRFTTGYGDFKLDLGGAFQLEDLQPQKSVVATQHDINANRMLRDASRQEFSFNGKLEYQPIEQVTLWGGGRYAHYRTKDNTVLAEARREEREVRWITASSPEHWGSMMWFPDQNGQYTDATDPRLNNGIVFENSNEPFNGVPFNESGAVDVTVYPEDISSVVTGYNYTPQGKSSGGGFSPAFGINVEFLPDTFVYASYTQGLRLPSLFETSQGTQQVTPGKHLEPERSRSWEVGVSALRSSLLAAGDEASAKLAFFDNDIKNYITRYYDPSPGKWGQMTFSNTDRFRTRGLELQSHYDAGRVFADLSATYYLKTETCDAAFAAKLRASANRYQPTQNTPDCTPGSYMGSYTNTQNPPKFSANLTTGLRFFDEALTVGGRMTYTSGPTAQMDKPWQTGATTPQIDYRSVALFDLFLKYKVLEHTELNLSVQNLTDRYYLDPLAQSFMPAPGRTVRMGVQTRF
ncbi:TonB-dependent receptor [Pseudomonas entomophila]|uniref:TonB-dependent receptor n=2 Tax=Pseudomonas entomophila TaxID=312306 RepID=A0ABY9QNI2_9PSED|nr:TonB-dependent receptor [Pseudomonas entomophila]WMW05603.1 TonB-dependent receptor [Pseudomonas entomophila]